MVVIVMLIVMIAKIFKIATNDDADYDDADVGDN